MSKETKDNCIMQLTIPSIIGLGPINHLELSRTFPFHHLRPRTCSIECHNPPVCTHDALWIWLFLILMILLIIFIVPAPLPG